MIGQQQQQPQYVAYYRVSTKRQGASGLGLEAQQDAVEMFCEKRGAQVIDEYREVESGANDDRPALRAALQACALYGVPLLIAKLDRLSRSAAFLMRLQESGAKFTCVDNPDANDETVGILAVVARGERERARVRTKEALKAAKKRGVKLGGARPGGGFTDETRKLGPETRKSKSRQRAELYRDIISEVRAEGASTLAEMASALQARNVPNPSGKSTKWYPATVKRVLDALGGE